MCLSAYPSEWIRGKRWYHDCEEGMGSRGDIAKIRISGHKEGRRKDLTHNCVDSKKECLCVLNEWVDEIIAEHSETAKAILKGADHCKHERIK